MSEPRLHVVTGKGGVGKSTIAAALAWASASRGSRTLAIEIPARGGLARILDAPRADPGVPVPTREGVWVTHFDGASALTEYLTLRGRLGRLQSVVLDHPLYRAFVAAAPGVQELMAMGKVRDELRKRDGGRRRWDVVVLDAGASGHALQLLRMPAAAAATFTAGLVHREASRIDAVLRDDGITRVHVVATPEQMPLAEASEVITALRDELHLPLGTLLVNRCRPPPPPGIEETLTRLRTLAVDLRDYDTRDAVERAARRGHERVRIQEEGIAAIEARTGVLPTRLPRLVGEATARARAERLISHLQGALR